MKDFYMYRKVEASICRIEKTFVDLYQFFENTTLPS